MREYAEETIAALCTGVGGALSVIRLSGPHALAVTQQCFQSKEKLAAHPREMIYGSLRDEGREGVLAVYMKAPRSYTGEDVCEIHAHGGFQNARKILALILACGTVRMARPGEFTLRAFLNGKMDLTQAEAVADLIGAQTQMARRTAEHQLKGSLRDRIEVMYEAISNVLAECESRLDFPEDVPDMPDIQALLASLETTRQTLNALLALRREGMLLREGLRVALVGAPNAGKSSLLNALLGYDRAIVTDIPGTTRDALEERCDIRGIPVRIFDTAGIHETEDAVEKLGVERSENVLMQSDIILYVRDCTAPDSGLGALLENEELAARVIALWNKCDLAPKPSEQPGLAVSAKTQAHFAELFDAIEAKAGLFKQGQSPEFALNARQGEALQKTLESVQGAIDVLVNSSEQGDCCDIAAVFLRDARTSLGLLNGRSCDPDLLDTIFSRFCIGK